MQVRLNIIDLDEIKQVCGVGKSEELFGIDAPPAHQCQVIDRLIKVSQDCEKNAASIGRSDDVQEAQSTARDIEWDISGLASDLEKVRKELENVRAWGQAWKDLAKRIIERNPEGAMMTAMEDEFYPVFDKFFKSNQQPCKQQQ